MNFISWKTIVNFEGCGTCFSPQSWKILNENTAMVAIFLPYRNTFGILAVHNSTSYIISDHRFIHTTSKLILFLMDSYTTKTIPVFTQVFPHMKEFCFTVKLQISKYLWEENWKIIHIFSCGTSVFLMVLQDFLLYLPSKKYPVATYHQITCHTCPIYKNKMITQITQAMGLP